MNVDSLMQVYESGQISEEITQELGWALAEYIRTGRSMNDILGLSSGGNGRTLRTQFLIAMRDKYLALAWDALGKPNNTQGWLEFAYQVKIFVFTTWSRWGNADTLPETYSEFQRCLWHAQRAYDIPESPAHLRRAIREYKTRVSVTHVLKSPS